MVTEELKQLLLNFTDPESDLLKKIDRETNVQVLMPRMLSGHYQGRMLSMLSKLIAPTRILEIGTFTGYASLCLAEGLNENGKLYTIDINEELEDRVRGYFEDSGISSKIDYRIGHASTLIPQLIETWDLVFIDADKKNNGIYFDLVINNVKPGGLIIVDNVLWSGKVLSEVKDADTKNIVDFNAKIMSDDRVDKLILPVRDGLFLIRKK